MAKVLTATEPFFWGQRFVAKGEAVSSDDPVAQGREHLFTVFGVEAATASPGEKRNVTIPRKKKPAARKKKKA